MIRSLVKDSLIYSISSFLTKGLSFLLIPLYTRVLTPTDYGSLDLFLVFANIVALTISLEINQAVSRFFVTEDDQKRKVVYSSTALWFTFFCYTTFLLPCTLFSKNISFWILGRQGLESAFQLGLVYIWVMGIFHLLQNQFRWEFRPIHYACCSILHASVTATIAVWFTWFENLGLDGLLLGMITGGIAAISYGFCFLRKSYKLRFEYTYLKKMLSYSWPLVPSGIAVWVSTYIDRMMINSFLTVEDVGLYGVGFRLASVVGLMLIGFKGALTPLVISHHKEMETPKKLEKIFRGFLALSLFMYVAVALFAYDLIRLLADDSFHAGAQVVVFLIPAILLSKMYIFAPGISIAKKTKLLFWTNTFGAFVNIVLNYVLIPTLGIKGAALATMTGYFCVFVAFMAFSQRFYYVPHNWKLILALSSIAAVTVLLVPKLDFFFLNRWTLNLLALMLFSLICLLLGTIKRSEIQQVFFFLLGLFKIKSS